MAEEFIEIRARVLKKHPFSRTLYFIDVVYHNPVEDFPQFSYSFASVVVKIADDDSLPNVIAGDVIEVRGKIQNYEHACVQKRVRPSILVEKSSFIKLAERWRLQEDGFFSFESEHLQPGSEFQNGHRLDFPSPTLLLQVKHKGCERIISSLAAKYGATYKIRESTTCYVKNNDRVVLMELIPSSCPESPANIILELVADEIIAPYLLRVYSANYPRHHLYYTIDASFSAGLQDMLQFIVSHNSRNREVPAPQIRLHCYPKYLAKEVLDHPLGQTVNWSPKDYDLVLSIAMVDGLFAFSLMERAQMFIGDLRERKQPAPALAAAGDGTVVSAEERICRAQDKLEEIMQRNGWVSDGPEPRPYQLAVDIGASPGGWTTFLARSVRAGAVLSVDRGELLLPRPLPANVVYWQVHGEEAIQRLASMKESSSDEDWDGYALLTDRRVDLFCCDANISPFVSVGFLFTCQDRGLLAESGRFVVTFKNLFHRKDEWERGTKECLALLSQRGIFRDIQVTHLLANTAKETTVTGQWTL